MKPLNMGDLDEAIKPFMLSYSDRFGKHAGFQDAKTLQDLQTKAANLRKKVLRLIKWVDIINITKYERYFDFNRERVGYKQVGMKKKGDKMVLVVTEDFKVEEYITEEDDTKKLENELKQKENEIEARTKSRNRQSKKCSKVN